jgi:hypothetical protein
MLTPGASVDIITAATTPCFAWSECLSHHQSAIGESAACGLMIFRISALSESGDDNLKSFLLD